jgi:hypothetical protein
MGVAQHAAAEYISRLLRLKTHLIMKFYEPKTIMSRVGELSQADQQLVPQALALIKNSEMSQFRLSVSVDSIQLPNFVQEKQARSEFIGAITGLMAQMIPAIKQTPEIAPLAVALIKFGVAGFPGASTIEGMVDASLDQLLAAQVQQSQQQKPPSEEEIKAQMHAQTTQAKVQVAMMQADTDKQIAQLNAQVKAQELQLKQQDMQMKAVQMAHEEAHWQDQNDNNKIDSAHKIAMDLTTGGE